MQPKQPQKINLSDDTASRSIGLPYAVPEYLGLNEKDLERPKKKRLKRFLLTFCVLGIAIIIITASYLWFSNENDRLLQRAIENMLTQQNVSRKINIVTTAEDNKFKSVTEVNIDAHTKLTDPSSPQSKYSYESTSLKNIEGPEQSKDVLKAETRIIGAEMFTFFKTNTGAVNSKITENVWYSSKLDSKKSPYDPLSLAILINSPLSVLVTGNFSESIKETLGKYIETNTIYTIKRSSTETLQGVSYNVLDIDVNPDEIEKLFEFVNKNLAKNFAYQRGIKKQSLKIWINPKTNLPHKYSERAEYFKGQFYSDTTTTLSYNEDVDITAPSQTIKKDSGL